MSDKTEILRATRDRLDAEMHAIHTRAGERSLNGTEQARWTAIESELDEVREELREAEEADARAERVAADRAKWNSLQVGSTGATHYAASDVARMGGSEARSAALRAIESAAHLEGHQRDYADQLVRSDTPDCRGDVIARYVALTECPEYRSAFMQLVADPHPVLSAPEAAAVRAVREYRAASLSDASGGYGVPATLDSAIVLTAQGSANPLWNLATRKTITTDVWKGVSSDGSSWSWDTEASEVSDDAPTLGQPTITPHMARGFIPYSIEIGQDYPEFVAEMSRLLGEGFAELTAAAFVTGSGDGQPFGIVTALDANTNAEFPTTTSGEFTYADVHAVWSALPDRARGNATWLAHPGTFSHLAAAGDTYGSRTASLDGSPSLLRGRPVAESSYLDLFAATTGAQNIAVVGDFRKYYVIQRAGMSVETIPHLFGTTNNRPTGQRGLFAWARVGADSVDDTAFRLLQNAV